MRLKQELKQLLSTGVFCAGLMAAPASYAEQDWRADYAGSVRQAAVLGDLNVRKRYALGINRFDLATHTEIIGWRLSDAWYFGRQDGLDSGLTLVWQQDNRQISLSRDGLRLTRFF